MRAECVEVNLDETEIRVRVNVRVGIRVTGRVRHTA